MLGRVESHLGESSPPHTHQVSLEPDTFNNYFLNSEHYLEQEFDKSIKSAIDILRYTNLLKHKRSHWRMITPDGVSKTAAQLP